MKKAAFFALGAKLGLKRDKIHDGVALRGELCGAEVCLSQCSAPMGPDPRPRPFTELRLKNAGQSRGTLLSASPDQPGDTGDRAFDERFRWFSVAGSVGPRPAYLDSARLRSAIRSLDLDLTRSIGHRGAAVFQVDHLDDGTTRMMILSHLPDPHLLERALRLLVALSTDRRR